MARAHLLRLGCWLALMSAAADVAGAQARQASPLEAQVKGAFLAKFAGYVNWPPGALGAADDPLLLCVIGRDPFGADFDGVTARQRVDQHPIMVRRLDSTAGAARCHIAFLGGSAKQSTAAMLEALSGQPILTITDGSLGTGRGMVHFALKDGRVRFHIDDALAARANLSISARLLDLALSVKSRTRAS